MGLSEKLFKPAWMTDKPSKVHKAIAAVERMDDYAALIQVVCDAPMGDVKKAAFAKLNLSRIANRDQLIALAHHAPTHTFKHAVLDQLDDEELWNYLLSVHDNDLVRACAQRITDLNWLYENLLNADRNQWDIWSTNKVLILDTIVDRTDDKSLLRTIVSNRKRIKLEATVEESRNRTKDTVGVTKAWQAICCKALGKATGDSSLYDIVRLPNYRRSIDGTERLIQFELMKEKDPELARLTRETDEDALMAAYQNTSQPIEHRVVAAKRLAALAGNEGPCRELLDNCTVQKSHLLYQTECVFWERQESVCIRCLERGGSYEDDGHTRHFGFAFWEDPCSGDLPYDGCNLLYVKNSQGQMAIDHSRVKPAKKPPVASGQRMLSRKDLIRLAKLQKEEQEARAKAKAEAEAADNGAAKK